MKRTLLCLLCILAALFLAVGCDTVKLPDLDGIISQKPKPTPSPDDTVDPEEPDTPDTPDTPEEADPVYYTVTYRDRQKQSEKLFTQKVKEGESLSAEQIAAWRSFTYHGYSYAAWHTDIAKTAVFDPLQRVTQDITVYGDRGKLAGKGITYEYDSVTCTLTLTGEGEMFPYLYNSDVPWYSYRRLIKQVSIDPRITTIANYAFHECTALKKVTLPSRITKIGKGAFKLSAVSDINFPDSLLTIGESAFESCEGLTHIDLNRGLSHIENYAFAKCVNISSMVFTDTVLKCDTSAFLEDNALRSAYYIGTKEALDKIQVAIENFWLFDLANIYFIAEQKPTDRGPYWYYDDDGGIKQWYRTVSFYASSNAKMPFLYDYVDTERGIDAVNVAVMEGIRYHGYRFASWVGADQQVYKNYKVGTKLSSDLRLYGKRGNLCGDSLTWAHREGYTRHRGNGRYVGF